MKANGGRIMVALHEGKVILSKVLQEVPGCDPQLLNKLYDRDEFSNSVLATASKFSERLPWTLFWLALDLVSTVEM